MNKRNRNQMKTFFTRYSDSFDPGASMGYGDLLSADSLQTIVESIRSDDGIQQKVNSFTVAVRSNATDVFAYCVVVFQTAGVVQDVTNQAITVSVNTMLNLMSDDVFGYDIIVPFRMARKSHYTGSAAYSLETTFQLPRKILDILNKETETERLQELYLAIVGFGTNTATVAFVTGMFIEYTEQRKIVVLR